MIRLTDEQWERIRKHFPEEHIPDGRPGRKPIPTRHVLEAVLWILNTGAQWHMLPQSYPNYKTVHRRFQTWCCHEILRRVLTDVANELRDRGALDEKECFIDATFVMAKGGGSEIGPTKRGKGMKIMAIVDRHGLPLSVSTHAARQCFNLLSGHRQRDRLPPSCPALSRSRTEPAGRVSRAAMLLGYREKPSFFAVGRRLGVHHQTVQRCVERAMAYGALAALDDRSRPGKEPTITPEAKAWLVSLACDKAKEHGYPHELWTTRLLARHARERGPAAGHQCLARLAQGTVCKLLGQEEIKPHKVRYYLERRDAEFEPKMAEVLCVYREVQVLKKAAAKAEKSKKPVAIVSYDEKPGIQAIATTTPDLPPVPGRHASFARDHEYKCHGTLSLLAGIDLLTGKVHALVRERHRMSSMPAMMRSLSSCYCSARCRITAYREKAIKSNPPRLTLMLERSAPQTTHLLMRGSRCSRRAARRRSLRACLTKLMRRLAASWWMTKVKIHTGRPAACPLGDFDVILCLNGRDSSGATKLHGSSVGLLARFSIRL